MSVRLPDRKRLLRGTKCEVPRRTRKESLGANNVPVLSMTVIL
jgi:hypothetical protein